jgi:hypothetical protein
MSDDSAKDYINPQSGKGTFKGAGKKDNFRIGEGTRTPQISGFSPEALSDVASEISPRADHFQIIDVHISPDSVAMMWAIESLDRAISRAVRHTGGDVSFTRQELTRYIYTLVQSRIDQVNGERRPVIKPTEKRAVPALISASLEQLGRVTVVDYKLELRPVWSVERIVEGENGIESVPIPLPDGMTSWTYSRSLEDQATISRISTELFSLEEYGFVMAIGFATDVYGSFDVMAMELVGDEIRSITNTSHPVYSIFAAMLGVSGISAFMSPPIRYADIYQIRSMIDRLQLPRRA